MCVDYADEVLHGTAQVELPVAAGEERDGHRSAVGHGGTEVVLGDEQLRTAGVHALSRDHESELLLPLTRISAG